MGTIKKIQYAFLFSISTLLLVGFSQQSNAQYKKNKSSITGSKFKMKKRKPGGGSRRMPQNYLNSIKGMAGINGASYYGDLCDGPECMTIRPSLTLGANYRWNQHLTFRGSLSWFRLKGDDANTKNELRNLHFRSDNFEFKLDATYDILPYAKLYRRRKEFIPYVFGGIAFFTYNPKAQLDGKWHSLRKYKTEGNDYGSVGFALPYGIGTRIKVNPTINVNIEIGYRWAFTDYIDDVSNAYNSENLAKPLNSVERRLTDRINEGTTEYGTRKYAKRGNSSKNDGYFIFGASIDYTLKVMKQHYNIRKNSSRMRIKRSIKR